MGIVGGRFNHFSTRISSNIVEVHPSREVSCLWQGFYFELATSNDKGLFSNRAVSSIALVGIVSSRFKLGFIWVNSCNDELDVLFTIWNLVEVM